MDSNALTLATLLSATLLACSGDSSPATGEPPTDAEPDVQAVDVAEQPDTESPDTAIDSGPEGVSDATTADADPLEDVSEETGDTYGVADADAGLATDAGPDPGCAPSPADEPGLVQTAYGTVSGVLEDGVWSWKGIPFAAPPVGELRWRLPRDPDCWEDVRAAESYGPLCPQLEGDDIVGDEDCLHLNVWAPDGEPPDTGWPVLFFIHGGGHVQGGSGVLIDERVGALYDGTTLAQRGPAVVVTINYRLGALGYLALPELEDENGSVGNWGYFDQLRALEWTRDNIFAFGGDPDRVTVFGESAGGVSTCIHIASSLSTGLLDGAIIQSASCTAEPLEEAAPNASTRVAETSCGADEDVVACMRDWDAATVISELPGVAGLGSTNINGLTNTFGPVVDGVVLEQRPHQVIESGEHNPVPLIIGSNGAELATSFGAVASPAAYEALVRSTYRAFGEDFVSALLEAYPVENYDTPRDAAVALFSDAQFNCLARRNAARAARVQEAPSYHYYFTRIYEGARGDIPPAHGNELLYVFGTLAEIPAPLSEGDASVIADIQGYWTSFAENGDPNDEGLVTWQAVSGASGPSMRFESPVFMDEDALPLCDQWDVAFALVGL